MKNHAGITSAELARVREVLVPRRFLVGNDGTDEESQVAYFSESDDLFCYTHDRSNDCTCTARIRLCGILTYSVTELDAAKFPVVHEADA